MLVPLIASCAAHLLIEHGLLFTGVVGVVTGSPAFGNLLKCNPPPIHLFACANDGDVIPHGLFRMGDMRSLKKGQFKKYFYVSFFQTAKLCF